MDTNDNKDKIYEFFRFCVVGALCTGIDAVFFYLIRLFAPYQVSLISGYLISLIVNYFLTIFWTFKTRPNKQNAIGVISAHLFNLFIVRMGLMKLFVDVMLIDDRIAYLPTLLISVVTNYIIIFSSAQK